MVAVDKLEDIMELHPKGSVDRGLVWIRTFDSARARISRRP